MCNLTLKSSIADFNIVIAPQADFMACLFPALIAAAPVFIDSLMKCIAGGGQSCEYTPGNRTRCN